MGLILHVVPDLGLNGSARQLSLLVPSLTAENWHSHVATLHGGGAFEPLLRAANVPIHSLGGTHRLDARPWLALRRLIAELRPDLVHARRRAAVRLSTLVECWDGERTLVASDLALDAALGRFDRWLLRSAACIVSGSEAGRDQLRRAGMPETKIAIIPRCVAPEPVPERQVALRELQLPADARLIACAGSIAAGKGFREAAWVFDILKYVYPNLWLLVLGDGPQRDEMERFGRALGRDDFRVRFAGVRSDAAAVLALAEVVWVLGERGGRNVALEATVAGRPVVARRRPDLLEILGEGDTGFLVPKAEPHETARATRRLLDDTEICRRCGEAARKRAEQFAVAQILPRWAALYDRLSERG